MAAIDRPCRCGNPATVTAPSSLHKRTCPYWRPPIQVPIRDDNGQRLKPEGSSLDRKPRPTVVDAVDVIMRTMRRAYNELEDARGHLRTLEDELRQAQLGLGQLRDDLKE